MLKIFFIYALIAGITMSFYGFAKIKDARSDIEVLKKEYELTNTQIYIVFYLLLFVFGWAWIPYAAVKGIIRMFKGED